MCSGLLKYVSAIQAEHYGKDKSWQMLRPWTVEHMFAWPLVSEKVGWRRKASPRALMTGPRQMRPSGRAALKACGRNEQNRPFQPQGPAAVNCLRLEALATVSIEGFARIVAHARTDVCGQKGSRPSPMGFEPVSDCRVFSLCGPLDVVEEEWPFGSEWRSNNYRQASQGMLKSSSLQFNTHRCQMTYNGVYLVAALR